MNINDILGTLIDDGVIEEPVSFSAKEIKEDLDLYWKYMMKNNVDACIKIEKKYGLFGATPEYVTSTMQASLDDALALEPK